MTDNQQTEKTALNDLIEQLPEQFPIAEAMIKDEIAPLLIECSSAVRDHYIKIIKKQTSAASIKTVSLLIDEAVEAMNQDKMESGDDSCAVIDTSPDPEIVEAAEQIANDALLFKRKIDIVNQLGVINERKNIGLYQLVVDSRLVPMGSAGSEALAMKNSGHYGAGKSYPLFTALKLYPNSAYYLISSGSEKSLYSMEGGLRHKALILAEALMLESKGKKDNELAYGIRTLVSEGQLNYQTTVYEEKKPVTIVKKIAGPTSLVTTTVKGKLEEQLDDRMITSHPNTTDLQTRDILNRTASMAAGNDELIDEISIKAFQHFHDSLVSAEVVIPFAGDIALFVSQNGTLPISARRSFKRVISAIKTMTLLYQKQRSRDEQGRFIADYIDYAIVYQLMEESFAESLGDVKRYTDDRIRLIEKANMMAPRKLASKVNVATAAISQWSKPLIEKGVLTWCDENGNNFGDIKSLGKAKKSGKAYLRVSGGNRLPTPFQLTGDPRWDEGGELCVAYDLELDGGSDYVADIGDETVFEAEASVSDPIASEHIETGVKLLSEKLPDGILKFENTNREKTAEQQFDSSSAEDLFNEFNQMITKNQVGAVY